MTSPQLFHTLTYADAAAAEQFLEAIGFTKGIVVPDEADPTKVAHAEFHWRDHGGIMFGSVRESTSEAHSAVGAACSYLVVASDAEVDEHFSRALSAGARSIGEPADQDYGGRCCTFADPEGNRWSIGSYGGVRAGQPG